MTPRATLPGAAELFRATSPHPAAAVDVPASDLSADPLSDALSDGRSDARADARADTMVASVVAELPALVGGRGSRSTARRRSVSGPRGDRASSGRERHEEKITVYVSAAELVDLEHARLTLRAEHGIAVDRGRIVREALSVLLADLESKQDESILVRRLAES